MPRDSKFIKPRHDVVAGNDADANLPAESQFARNFDHRIGATSNVDATGVGSDLDSSFDTRGQNSPHQRNEIFCVTGIGIAGLLLLHDRHRDFREIVEHQIVDWSTFNLAHGCVRKISPEALSGCYAYFLFHQEFWNLPDATKKHKKSSHQERNNPLCLL